MYIQGGKPPVSTASGIDAPNKTNIRLNQLNFEYQNILDHPNWADLATSSVQFYHEPYNNEPQSTSRRPLLHRANHMYLSFWFYIIGQ